MQRYATYLDALAEQAQAMTDLVSDWVRISSGSHDVNGLGKMAEPVKAAFARLGCSVEELPLPPQSTVDSLGLTQRIPLGNALRFKKRPEAKLQVFLGIHMDVVYGSPSRGDEQGHISSPSVRIENGIMYACGAADAKGGLVILLKALETLEASPFATGLGWEVLLNPDEELSSPGSAALLAEAASRNHLGLLFEPSLPDGSLVGMRKGSGNFSAVIRGRAAHAGRDPHLGRNAIHALAHLVVEWVAFGKAHPSISVNFGKIEGGGPLNRVPDLAIGRFNLRVESTADQTAAEQFIQSLLKNFGQSHGVTLELLGGFTSPPKPINTEYQQLLDCVRNCGLKLGLDLKWQSSGGVSDGNKLAAAGLPNVDTLGAVGGNIHSPDEYLILDSLVERSRLTALLLMQLGSGEILWPTTKLGKGV